MNEHINKQRLFDYFAGKSTALEKKQIDEWSREPSHTEQFYRWLDEWEQSHLQFTADQPVAFSRYHDFLYADQSGATNAALVEETPSRFMQPFSGRTWLVWAIAASVILMVGLFAFRELLLTRTYETAYGETRLVNLPDGSAVTLNSNSSLQIPRFGFGKQWPGNPWFGSPTRQVVLVGEALFSVTHTATNQRFVVRITNAEVVVLGTEFTVFARPRGTKVVLNRGKVEVHYQQTDRQPRQVTMKPGDLLTLTPEGELTHQQLQQPPASPAWTEHRFVFDKTQLTEIVAILAENYGLTAEIADAETGQMTISGAYSAQTADELLRIVAEVLNIDIDRQSDKLILTQKPLQ
ncbi:MAG: FecR domain-containing protein [Spirosoma sp.]|nr:FecR domain-containing protein [Spirosoma sp.]